MSSLIHNPEVTYISTDDPIKAQQLLSSLTAPIVACDFETASRYTDEEKAAFQEQLSTVTPNSVEYHTLLQRINSDGLSHPSLSRITHMSLAYSETEAYVFIVPTPEMESLIYSWITTTPIKQVWHNLCFDGKHIFYNTGTFPQDYEDSQILAKTLLNHVNNQKSLTGLKHLMAYKYGAWAIASESFHLSQMYDPQVLHYAAIDACATLSLWNDIQSSLH